MPHELTEKKKRLFWSVVISYSMQQQTISQSDCDMQWKVDFTWQPATTSSVVIESQRWRFITLSKAKLAPRKGHGHCLVVCCGSDPLQLSDSQRNRYIWEICSVNWDAPKTAMPAAGIGQQSGPNSWWQRPTARRTTNASKFEWTELWSFVSPTIFTWPLTNRLSPSSISTTFCRENASTTSRRKKMLPKSSLNPKHKFLGYRNN